MNSVVKYTLIAAAIGGVVYLVKNGVSTITDWASKINIALSSIGRPEFRNGQVTIPVALTITNPTPVAIPVDNIQGKIFLLKSGMWQPVGNIAPTGNIQFAPGIANRVFYPSLDFNKLKSFFTVGSLLQTGINFLQNSGNLVAKIKVEINATVKTGFPDYVTSFEQDINLNDLLRAVA